VIHILASTRPHYERLPIQDVTGKMKRRGEGFETSSAPNRNGSRKDRVMAAKALPSPDVLRQLIRYEPETGRLFWKERVAENRHGKTWNARHAGKEAFIQANAGGYKSGAIFDIRVSAHRVGWAMFTGEWPAGDIDNINVRARKNAAAANGFHENHGRAAP
jgi:hypothetical protein